MENEINIEEELKFMNVYKSDDPNNYRSGKPGQVLIYDEKGNLRWVDNERTRREELKDIPWISFDKL